MSALSRLRLRITPVWPLSLLASESMLQQYNAVLVLLLQLRWARQSLQSVRFAGWKDSRRQAQAAVVSAAEQRAGRDSGVQRAALAATAAAKRDGLQHQMLHLADAALQYVTDRVAAAGAWLEGAVAGCASLDEMHCCREQYQRAVARYCLLGSEGVARLVHDALLKLLDASLHYCALQHKLSRMNAAAEAAEAAAGGGGAAGGAAAVEVSGAHEQQLDALALAQRRAALCRQIDQLGREYSARQRLLLRVLRVKVGASFFVAGGVGGGEGEGGCGSAGLGWMCPMPHPPAHITPP